MVKNGIFFELGSFKEAAVWHIGHSVPGERGPWIKFLSRIEEQTWEDAPSSSQSPPRLLYSNLTLAFEQRAPTRAIKFLLGRLSGFFRKHALLAQQPAYDAGERTVVFILHPWVDSMTRAHAVPAHKGLRLWHILLLSDALSSLLCGHGVPSELFDLEPVSTLQG